jgi:menaquinone-dependent protoporphyrinogen oxidase
MGQVSKLKAPPGRELLSCTRASTDPRRASEFIAERLQQRGILAEVRDVEAVHDLGGFDVFAVGSAVYMGHWMKEATEFVRRNRSVLAGRPVWLFSSGPLGTETKDAQGRELIDVAQPQEIIEFRETINPRDHRVFFGTLDPSKLSLAHRMTRKLPAARALFPEGDFRDWKEIEAWASSIAQALETRQTASESGPGA